MMKEIKKTFKGIAIVEGDDGFCYGVHASFRKQAKNKQCFDTIDTSMIDWLDEQFQKLKGKKVEVTVIIKPCARVV